jgi:UDPglucose 6-dehydrogenase
MNIVIIGSGYVGTTAAALFSVSGHHVIAIDLDAKKVSQINNGKAPFFEEGLDNIITAGITQGSLVATSDYAKGVSAADIVLSCVGTPDNPDGSSNLSYVFSAAKEASLHLKEGAIFVQKSTVPVGTGRKIMELLPETISYVSNPEFLRESTAIYDTLMFDRIVAGGDNEQANQAIIQLHQTVEDHFEDISRISTVKYTSGHTGNYVSTNLESAELIKVTSNAFLALKISFANSIAQLCDATGGSVEEVMSIVGEDARIGKAFFNAGRGYGGGCFPKDVSGLISSAQGFGVSMPIMEAASTVNASMPGYIISRLVNESGLTLSDQNVAVLGLAFKSGTSDARKSPAIKLANRLIKEGAKVTAYDPQANKEARETLDPLVNISTNITDAIKDSSIVLIATDWPEFKDITQWLPEATNMKVLVDAVNCVDASIIPTMSNVQYISVGRNI